MRYLIVILLFVFFDADLCAQSVSVNASSEVKMVMDRYGAENRMSQFVEGWRIQVVSSTDRRKIEEVKKTFIQSFPNIPIKMEHTPPYYKIRAGAFTTKLDAMGLLYTIKQEIPGAYPSKDNKIKPSEMVGIY
jgi:hypothetical protein